MHQAYSIFAAMSMDLFFGYGSLVNSRTHAYSDLRPATLSGWRRIWRHTPLRPVAFLTAEPAPGCAIEGMIAAVPGGDWTALDRREAAYDRIAVTDQIAPAQAPPARVAVYSVPEGKHGAPDDTHPVLLSYLDVVVQGYLDTFGRRGVDRFFDTTFGWDAPVLDDRAEPIYPRHQTLSRAERAIVDAALDARGVRRIARAESRFTA